MNYFKHLLFLGIIVTLSACKDDRGNEEKSSDNYRIMAELTGFPEGTKFYLYNLSTMADVDSAVIRDNKFVMEGHIPEPPEQFWINTTLDEEFIYSYFLIMNEELRVMADKSDFPYYVETSGSKTDSNSRKVWRLTPELDIERDSLRFYYHGLPEEEQQKHKETILPRMEELSKQIAEKTIDYIKNTNDTYASVINLGYYKDDMPTDSVRAIFERYTDELKESKYGNLIKVYLESGFKNIGDPYYDIEAINQRGKDVKLSQLREEGKYLLINYTSAYCGHCIRATEELKAVHQKYQNSLNLVSLSADPQKEDWQNSVERDGNQWPSLWDGEGRYSKNAIHYNFSGTPTFLLIDPQGIIVDRWYGYNKGELTEGLEEYL